MGLLLAVIATLLIQIYGIPEVAMTSVGIAMITIATLLVILAALIRVISWGPLQKAEQNLTPRVMEMLTRDRQLRFTDFWMIFFLLLTFLIVLDLTLIGAFSKTTLMTIWFFGIGGSLDLLHHMMKRLLNYLNPFGVVAMFTHQAKVSIQNEHEIDLCQWIDGLSEVAIKGIQKGSISLANRAITELESVTRTFLESSKSISHRNHDKQTEQLGISDKVSYILFYVMQRLELTFNKALEQQLEPTCSHVIAILGQIAFSSAKYDLTIANHPIQMMGKLGKKAEECGIHEVAEKTICTLVEVAKIIVTEVDLTYFNLKDAFLSLISQIDAISKEMFRQDKTMSFQILTQPFHQLKEIFTTEKIAAHQDTPIIIQHLDNTLGDFATLEQIMHKIPPISPVTEKEEK